MSREASSRKGTIFAENRSPIFGFLAEHAARNTFEWLIDNSHSFSGFVIKQLNARCGYYVGLVGNLRLNKASARVAFCLSELFNPQLYAAPNPTLGLSQE